MPEFKFFCNRHGAMHPDETGRCLLMTERTCAFRKGKAKESHATNTGYVTSGVFEDCIGCEGPWRIEDGTPINVAPFVSPTPGKPFVRHNKRSPEFITETELYDMFVNREELIPYSSAKI